MFLSNRLSIVFGVCAVGAGAGGTGFNLLEGHSKATMFLIINNAAQGVLSSFFYKYAGKLLASISILHLPT